MNMQTTRLDVAPIDRLREIDGIRGWAAFSVMCCHIVGQFYDILPGLRNTTTNILLNGDFDVVVFFVLSGDALSANYWRTRCRGDVVRLAVKRYSRLTIPILASCLLMYVLLQCGLVFTHEAAVVLRSTGWLGKVLNWHYDLPATVMFSLVDVYFHHTESGSLNPPLWTMSIELMGSLLVFLLLLCARTIRRFVWVLVLLTLMLLVARSYMACFVFGVLLGKLRALGWFATLRASGAALAFIPLALGLLMLAGFLPWQDPARIAGLSCLSGGMLFCIYANPMLCDWFRMPVSRWLGRISFPLYLLHFPVLASFTCGMVVLADHAGMLNNWIMGAIIAASVAISLALAVAFGPVEKFTRIVGDALCRRLIA